MNTKKLNKIEWHIRNNFLPCYSENIIKGMLQTISDYLNGYINLNDTINNSNVTVSDLFEDLRITNELI